MSDCDDAMLIANQELRLEVGDIFEDCAFHPVLCLGVDYEDDDIWGISLIDGSHPRSCSLVHCGVRKLTLGEAWRIKTGGPSDESAASLISEDKRWWLHGSTTMEAKDLKATIVPLKLNQTKLSNGQKVGASDDEKPPI